MVKAVIMPKLGQSEETVKIVNWRKQVGRDRRQGRHPFRNRDRQSGAGSRELLRRHPAENCGGGGRDRPRANHGGFCRRSRRAGSGGCAAPRPRSEAEGPTPATPLQSRLPSPVPAERERRRARAPSAPASPACRISAGVRAASCSASVPRAAKLAKESVIDPTPIAGTGPGGRIVEADVRQYLEAQGYGRLRITPTAKKLAAREGINLLSSRAERRWQPDHRGGH